MCVCERFLFSFRPISFRWNELFGEENEKHKMECSHVTYDQISIPSRGEVQIENVTLSRLLELGPEQSRQFFFPIRPPPSLSFSSRLDIYMQVVQSARFLWSHGIRALSSHNSQLRKHFFFRLLIVHVKKQFFVCPLSRRELKSKVPFVVLWRWWTDRLVNGRKYIEKNCVNSNVKIDKWNIVTDYHLFRSGGPVFSLDCFSLDASMSGVVLIEFSMQCPSADRASMWPIGFIGRMWIYFSIFRFIVAQLIEYIRMWG